MKNQIMVSGIKPTGKVTLGNYIGAIKQFQRYKDQYDLKLFVADLHALTLPIDPKELKDNVEDLVAIYLASGLDDITIFKQSDISAHAELNWILTCNTVLGELTKMPQYKKFLEDNFNKPIPCGMLMYPSLMNADILLYDTEFVPVGIDQKPHVDLTRDVAEKFNVKYPNTFILPKALIAETGSKIMSLSNPTKKMSKSESDKGTIYLLEDLEITRKKIMKATTDGEGKVYYDKINKPGISNLLEIYSAITNISLPEVIKEFESMTDYGAFKRIVSDAVCEELGKIQQKVNEIKSTDTVARILHNGKIVMQEIANKKLDEVYRKIGLR